jgi:hypothetical protein
MKKSHKHILIAVVVVVIIIFVVGVGSVALGPGITTSKDTPDGMKWSWKSNMRPNTTTNVLPVVSKAFQHI